MKSYLLRFALPLALLIVAVPLIVPDSLLAQSNRSAISWHARDFDNRVVSLGQSTSALFNPSSHSLNPAVPLPEEGVLYLNSPLLANNFYQLDDSSLNGLSLFNPSLAYAASGFTFRLMADRSAFSTPILQLQTIRFVNTMVKLHTGYAFSETFSAGVGFTYSNFTSDASVIDVGNQEDLNMSAWGLSLGLYYRDELNLGGMNLNPQAGLSFNDLSTGFDDERFGITQPMPGQIRLAFGLDTRSEALWMDRPVFSFGVYTGLSKYLSRVDFDEETDEPTVPSGFEAVFTGWKPLTFFDGMQMQELSVGDQISASIGIEAGFAETLFLRFGRFGGAERWAESHTSFGAGIDLYYVSINVAHIRYNETADLVWPLEDGTSFSITARIPLDGQTRDTLLGRWFGSEGSLRSQR